MAVDVWLTTGDRSSLLSQQQDLIFQPGNGSGGFTINVNPNNTFQTIEGFGASLTDSSAWLIENKTNADQRDDLMKLLFDPSNGIGINYLRLPMGASDFTASGFYTYNDLPNGQTDVTQSQFSISHDQQYIIPQLQEALAINPDLKLMGSPWSAPAWMKTSNSLIGGQLESQFYSSYATYFQSYIEAYANEGLEIDAVTLQNEPLFTPGNYPGMSMSAAEQADLVKNHFGPTFAAANLDTKIVLYDHNWDVTSYAIDALNDPLVKQYVAGTAFHGYAGNVSAQSTVHNAHPDRGIYFTEISGGDFAPNFADNLVFGVENIIIGNMRNWGETAIYWNLALDENNGPHLGGCSDCRGVVTIDSGTGDVTRNEEYYTLAHASKFVQPGATRIDSRTIDNSVETVAFRNPDGSTALIALNPTGSSKSFRIVEGGEHFSYTLPGQAVATFTWPSREADFDNGEFEELGGSTQGWIDFGNAIGNVSASDELVLTGEHSLKLFGQFNGSGNFSGVSQGISVQPGDVVKASANTFIDSLDSILGSANEVVMKIEFFDKFGGAFGTVDLIEEHQITIADGSSINDVWQDHTLIRTAPTEAEEARLVFYFFQSDNDSGAVYIDEALIEVVALAASDFDHDGDVDQDDLLVWQNAYGVDTTGDADGNGTTDGMDFLTWQAEFTGSLDAGSATLAVPEPTSVIVLTWGLVAWLLQRPVVSNHVKAC
ncbi:MAG: glycoside hydrolase family 30 beta sandwich domain-containing protein [Planctomycetota bacterium]